MNKFYTIILATLLFATSAFAQSACEKTREEKGYPMHYCSCTEDHTKLNALPIDTTITDSIWFKSTLKVFINSGMTAYLYSETDVYFDIYQRCTTTKTLFDTVIAHNRAFEIDGASLSEKLAENGQSNANMAIYVCIHPKEEGIPSRVLCYPHGQGPASTCDDILPIVPGMTFVSSHANDVYELESTIIPENGDLEVEWFNYTGNCSLTITRGNCKGAKIVDVDLVEPYKIDRELLKKARDNGESLYLHFAHAEGTAGRIRVNKTEYIDVITTDTTICQGSGLQLPDTLLTESTVYPYDTIPYATGVYQVLNHRVTIVESHKQYETVEACGLYTWNGETYTESGDYVYTTTATNGCDSIVTLHLTINQSQTTEETAVACESYLWNGATYTTSGDYTYTTTTINGCDSIVTLHLTINQSQTTEETAVACDSYSWNGATYTASGDYTYTTTTINGCDSVVTLHLTINQSQTTEETAVACDSYLWNGATYTASGDYTFTTTTINGCDSIVTLHLTINQSQTAEETAVACDSYSWNGATYTASGDYTFTTTTINGCDSVVTLHLTINQSQTAEEIAVACDSYSWNGATYTTSGDYTYTTTTINGCDSIVTLHLIIDYSESVEETVVACDSYSWNGMTYTESGDYTYITTADNGCDRIEVLHLTIDICSAVEDTPVDSKEVRKILQGDQILILRNGKTYTLMGETL